MYRYSLLHESSCGSCLCPIHVRASSHPKRSVSPSVAFGSLLVHAEVMGWRAQIMTEQWASGLPPIFTLDEIWTKAETSKRRWPQTTSQTPSFCPNNGSVYPQTKLISNRIGLRWISSHWSCFPAMSLSSKGFFLCPCKTQSCRCLVVNYAPLVNRPYRSLAHSSHITLSTVLGVGSDCLDIECAMPFAVQGSEQTDKTALVECRRGLDLIC